MSIKYATNIAKELLPAATTIITGKIVDNLNPISAEELAYVNGADQARINEFVAGRILARKAATTQGVPNLQLLSDINGVPIWPNSIAGSISHKGAFCGVLIGSRKRYRSVGFDIEFIEHLDKSIWSVFASEAEMSQAAVLGIEESKFANMLFCAKESFFKALFPIYALSTPDISGLLVSTKIVKNQLVIHLANHPQDCCGGIVAQSNTILSWAFVRQDV